MIDAAQAVISINTQRQGEVVVIRPQLHSPTPLTLQYRMTVRRNSANGTSSIDQSGTLQNDNTASLISLSMPAGASCQVHLEVYQNDRQVQQIDSDCSN
jgi:hypothetical protein